MLYILSSLTLSSPLTRLQTEHVDSMKADYGGTEMRAALSKVFESRTVTAPTAVFVLTDGEVRQTVSIMRSYLTSPSSDL